MQPITLQDPTSKGKTTILVCTHTDSFYLQSDIYQPIHVGKALHPERHFSFMGDDTGDHISHKNGSYCELTAHYWAWKNLRADYIGICHYRRYFDFKARPTLANNDMSDVTADEIRHRDLGDPTALLADGTEAVLVRPSFLPRSVAQNYISAHVPEDFFLLCRVILKLHPDYEPTMRRHFFCSNKWIAYNMVFCRKALFDRYAEWMFGILAEVERCGKPCGYSYQGRIYGFMGEVLTPLFFLHNCRKIKYQPVLYVADKPGKVGNLTFLRNRLRYGLTFWLGGKPKNPAACDPRGMFYDSYFKRDGIDF